ncbi:uncharacterized protein TRIADDRAFT_53318 [Trichoplax adhaerens]|uniref:G-protein coupled receptors family 1 profile domain-containing protein n=1 Tax=Trichoplax adhaerens TaxID=10228 RepID=B3RNW7_TRIAD|nr:hypothetical protein TRIADDRAFT_53318 [Trichoplax adhaerens]EDV28086.1 hypothetical protein TRIADDRAFT_53318 [Trichoplax adhaerens]|eukprot:XP_002109920.1 hypothetical protein TRIADDRAFT_53318 [Trichoplax adhaerens]
MDSINNSESNDNNSQGSINELSIGSYVISSIFALIAIFSVISNLMFCIVIYMKKSSTTKAAEYLFLNLAIADMMAGLLMIILPGFVIPKPIFPYPHFGLELFCRLVSSNSFFFMLGFVSVWTLLAICIDRWYAIARPFYYKEFCTKKRALMVILIIWFANIGLATDNALNLTASPNGSYCVRTYFFKGKDKKILVTVLEVIRIFIPSLIIVAIYANIGWRLLYSSHRERNNSSSGNHVHYCKRDITIRKQVTIMSCIAAITFLVCWLPNEIFYTVTLYEPQWQTNHTARRITKILMALNSMLNPLIYAVSNKYYRQGFLELFRCQALKKKRTSSSFTNNTYVVKLFE